MRLGGNDLLREGLTACTVNCVDVVRSLTRRHQGIHPSNSGLPPTRETPESLSRTGVESQRCCESSVMPLLPTHGEGSLKDVYRISGRLVSGHWYQRPMSCSTPPSTTDREAINE